jgi:NAD(P) transhydrogenase
MANGNKVSDWVGLAADKVEQIRKLPCFARPYSRAAAIHAACRAAGGYPLRAFTEVSSSCCRVVAFFNCNDGLEAGASSMSEDVFDYDLLVIGSGPAGQRAAIQGAKLDKKVAIVERRTVLGGCSVNLGTIPSKTLREAALELCGYRSREFYGASYTVKQHITMQDLLLRTNRVIQHEIDVSRHQLMRNDVEVIGATASFVAPHAVRLDYVDATTSRTVRARKIVIAAGAETTRDPHIPFDGERIFTSDDVLQLERLPRTLAVVGAGVIGCEYASIFAALGVRVTLIDKRNRLLPFVDHEIVDEFCHHLRENRATLRLNESVDKLEIVEDEHGPRVRLRLDSGKTIIAEKALYSVGRTGATGKLNLAKAGLAADQRGRLSVDEHYRTEVPGIYAVGDLVGFPALASTSMEQGRLAACHAFGVKAQSVPERFPYGIYAVPEISMVGKTEEELTEAATPYEIGKARYKEIARGQILGDVTGLLKLIFHSETRQLLGVHIIGEGASELIHIGQAVLSFGGKIDYFIDTVFNYPTLAECYKVAAFDGINRLGVFAEEATEEAGAAADSRPPG